MGFLLSLGFEIYFWFLVLFAWKGSFVLAMRNNTDRHALLAFKNEITPDPHQVMSSWNDSTHFCKWVGVTCSLPSQRVVILNLGSRDLVGTISRSVGNLSFLTTLNLSSNNFHGKIPQELSHLSRLQHLDLSHNSLGGEIPLNLSTCSELRVLSLQHNSLIGSIPFQVSSLKKLSSLYLGVNYLTGIIPPSVGNCSLIRVLSLMQNSLHGSIPTELGQLSQLQIFQVSSNMLSGVPPPILYNITSIHFFCVAVNQLQGRIPRNLGQTLPNLRSFLVGRNKFEGAIPDTLSNASDLRRLDFAQNSFTGSIPKNLGGLTSLSVLNLGYNRLGYGEPGDMNFITSLSNCTVLERFHLDENTLGGVLPQSIGNLSTRLQKLTMETNLIAGPLPTSIENLINLISLRVQSNSFCGSIPFGLGKLQKLQALTLGGNKLSGQIPSSLGNLTLLVYLQMESNRLEGIIPPSLGNFKELLVFNISSNKLSSTIPEQVFTLPSLVHFEVADNFLSESLPPSMASLINLEWLDISKNNLSGDIPASLGSCLKLENLLMGDNLFQGSIPQSLKGLKGIKIIDFSHNNLSRNIPEFLMELSSLEYLDISYNDFEGKVPTKGIFMNASTISVRGNKKLCGGIKELYLPFCKDQDVDRSRNFLSLTISIIIAFGVWSFLLVAICWFACWLRAFTETNASGAATTSSALEKWECGTSFSEIYASTNGFSSKCLIGKGCFGSVYKGVLGSVAIEVMNLHQKGASESFLAECDVLRKIKHRNLIKVLNICSSIDFQGNKFKAIIFEFMANGCLEQWLHPAVSDARQESRTLSFIQRLNIAIDVAFGLEYLHHGYGEIIVHCDIKPSNILLDIDMTAHVGDFGLAKFLVNTTNDQQGTRILSSSLKGSIGYIPPEYGMDGKVSTHADIYSYGILLLEMFTGKRPTHEMFRDGLNLYSFVAMALPNDVLDIVDASLISETAEDQDEKSDPGNAHENEEAPVLRRRAIEGKREKCLISVLTIALSCCAPLPKDRKVASYIVKQLIDVRDLFLLRSIKGAR